MNPLFVGEKVRLTAFNKQDITHIERWYTDSDFLRRYDALPAYPQNHDQLEKNFQERIDDKNVYLFAIRPIDGKTDDGKTDDGKTDDLLGWLEVDGIIWAHRVCWISIAIGDSRQQGHGYGYDAMRLALNFIFGELNLHRVQLTVFDYNTPAIALYEKLGFTHEGTFRQFLQRDNARHDMRLYGLLADEWTG